MLRSCIYPLTYYSYEEKGPQLAPQSFFLQWQAHYFQRYNRCSLLVFRVHWKIMSIESRLQRTITTQNNIPSEWGFATAILLWSPHLLICVQGRKNQRERLTQDSVLQWNLPYNNWKLERLIVCTVTPNSQGNSFVVFCLFFYFPKLITEILVYYI